MASALIKFTQGANTDVAGRAVKGDMTSGTVTVSNSDNTGIVLWSYALVYVPPGSAISMTPQIGTTPTFTFAQPDVAGSYRVVLTTTDSTGGTDTDIRVLCVPFPQGFIAPPNQGTPPPRPASGPGSKPNEMNIGGQVNGWDGDATASRKLLYQLIRAVDNTLVVGAQYSAYTSNGTSNTWSTTPTFVGLSLNNGYGGQITVTTGTLVLNVQGMSGVTFTGYSTWLLPLSLAQFSTSFSGAPDSTHLELAAFNGTTVLAPVAIEARLQTTAVSTLAYVDHPIQHCRQHTQIHIPVSATVMTIHPFEIASGIVYSGEVRITRVASVSDTITHHASRTLGFTCDHTTGIKVLWDSDTDITSESAHLNPGAFAEEAILLYRPNSGYGFFSTITSGVPALQMACPAIAVVTVFDFVWEFSAITMP